jgi:hypothetical protein
MLLAALLLSAACGTGLPASAEESDPPKHQPCCPPHCPNCKAYCTFEWEKASEAKHCWCVAHKAICIPKITFPWEDCCEPKCARVKWVKRLKKLEYECEHCKCKWTAVEVPRDDCMGSYPGDCRADFSVK